MLLFPAILALQHALLRRRLVAILLPILYLSLFAETRAFAVFCLPTLVLIPLLSESPGVKRRHLVLVCLVPFLAGFVCSLTRLLPIQEMLGDNRADLVVSAAKRYHLRELLLRIFSLPPIAFGNHVGIGWVAAPLIAAAAVWSPRRSARPVACIVVAYLVCGHVGDTWETLLSALPV